MSISLPLDEDGFLRRECPTCEQEFKWHHDEADSPQYPDDGIPGTHYCPICGQPSGEGTWWTPAQLEYIQGLAMPKAMDSVFGDLERELKSSKYLKLERSGTNDFEVPDVPVEPNDMTIIEPPCHPLEPVKVAVELAGPFYCIICGQDYAV